ncbi:MAG: hypothetical protein ACR5LF_12670 [Symbiopectobacterium sp.]
MQRRGASGLKHQPHTEQHKECFAHDIPVPVLLSCMAAVVAGQ